MFSKKSIIQISAIALLGIGAISFVNDDPKKPDESRFTPVTLTRPGELDEPNTFEVLSDGRVLISERKGAIKLFDPITKLTKTVATLPVNTKYTSATGKVTEAEEGLLGLTIDPDFDKNHYIYTFYAHATEKKWMLTRWKFENDALVKGSEKTVLEFATQREVCCHTGGGLMVHILSLPVTCSLKALQKLVLKFTPWVTVTHGEYQSTAKPVGCIGAILVRMPLRTARLHLKVMTS
jgi:cytochrome c